MKKVFTVVFMFLLFSVNSFAEDKLNIPDGYWWEDLGKIEEGKAIKTVFMLGFLRGYNGYIFGYLDSYKMYNDTLKTSTNAGPQKCKNIYMTQKEIIIKESGLKASDDIAKVSDILMTKSVGYYVHELDSFLQTYPSCKRKDVGNLLLELARVWSKDGNYSYKYVGDNCLKNIE